jgi:RNA polymerase sigma factor (TIGR02999 family)
VELNEQVAALMAELRRGTPGAAEKLVEIFYPELRRLAASKMRSESPGHTWQPTVLVNELYLELRKIRSLKEAAATAPDESAAFLALAAHIMRRLLIHHVRPLRKKVERLCIDSDPEAVLSGELELHEIESALAAIEAIDPRLRAVVEMRVFGGFSSEEVAERLGCTTRTVTRHWTFARNWLEQNYLPRDEGPSTS